MKYVALLFPISDLINHESATRSVGISLLSCLAEILHFCQSSFWQKSCLKASVFTASREQKVQQLVLYTAWETSVWIVRERNEAASQL